MNTLHESDEAFLRESLALAERAYVGGDEPFGALLVVRGEVVFRASNQVILENDPTRHAELVLVSQAARELPAADMRAATLYASTEPCVMCAGAICRARVPRVVYGCSGQGLRDLLGGHSAVPCRQILQRPHHAIEVLGPLLEQEGLALHRRLRWWVGA